MNGMPFQLAPNQFVSDSILPNEYNQWKAGDRILIKASTGSGKNRFASDYCKDKCSITRNTRALILTNRKISLEQMKKQYSHPLIKFMSYQKLESLIKANKCYIHLQYSIIVIDEVHYFFDDSSFADQTDLTLWYLLHQCTNSIVLFLSATTNIFEKFMLDMKSIYQHQNYTIDHVYNIFKPMVVNSLFYFHPKTLPNLLKRIEMTNEKAIVFTTNIKKAYDYSQQFKDSQFICSDSNSKYRNKSHQITREEIENNEKFSCQILFTTSVLDNGVNLHDPNLKHIIIDIMDLNSIMQCLGRRRNVFNKFHQPIAPPNIYIRHFNYRDIKTQMRRHLKSIEMVDVFKRSLSNNLYEFRTKYPNLGERGLISLSNNEVSGFHLNIVKDFKHRYEFGLLERMSRNPLGHIEQFCVFSGFPIQYFHDLSKHITRLTLKERLQPYLNEKLFDEKIKKLKKLMQEDILIPVGGSGYHVSTINSYFSDIHSGFKIIYDKKQKENDRSSPNYGKHYWILIDTTVTVSGESEKNDLEKIEPIPD